MAVPVGVGARHLLSPKRLFEVGQVREPGPVLGACLKVYAAAVAASLIYVNVVALVHPWTLAAGFMGALYTLIFLIVRPTLNADPERPSPLDWALSATSLGIAIYFISGSDRFVERIPILHPLTTTDLVIGVIFVLLSLEATRRTTGLGLTFVVLLFLAYNIFGHHLPGVIGHGSIDLETFLETMVYSTYGINGVVANVAATYAFLFVMFGELLTRSGGGAFFYRLAAALTGRTVGGPAKIAVVSSGLYGMVSGNAVADVVTTGSVTIPIMKRLGYPPKLAAAVEVTASAGGSLMPPVMGAAAFVMAEYTGIPYGHIILAAAGPALLYYLAVFGQVHFYSKRRGLLGLEAGEIPQLWATLKQSGLFFFPLVVLVGTIGLGYTATFAAVLASASIVFVAALNRQTRVGPVGLFQSLAETIFRMVVITGTCAAAGLVIAGITMTGLAPKISMLVSLLTGGSLFPALLTAAVVTLVLGLGMPTVSAYIIAAVLVGPLMENLGVPKLAAHMFLLYYAMLSAMTPPVAVAAYAAAGIAGANPMAVGVLSVRLAVVAFIVPFGFVYGPQLILLGSPLTIVVALASAASGVWLMSATLEGYLHRALSSLERLVFTAAALFLMVPLDTTSTLLGGAAIAGAFTVWIVSTRPSQPAQNLASDA